MQAVPADSRAEISLRGSCAVLIVILGPPPPPILGLAPVLVHLSKDADGSYGFNPIAVNLLVEVVKTLFALGTLIAYVSSSACLGGGGQCACV